MQTDPLLGRPIDSSSGYLVSRISVEELFGRYNYQIGLDGGSAPRLMLLYADNGRGKSTILRILWHILAPAPNRGHRSALLQIPFKEIRVQLGRGDLIVVKRTHGLLGSYSISVRRGKRSILTEHYPPKDREPEVIEYIDESEELELSKEYTRHPNEDKYTKYLQSIDVLPFYLSDDRRVHTDNLGEGNVARVARARAERRQKRGDDSVPFRIELEIAIERVDGWIRSQFLNAQNAGSSSADDIYAEVILQLSRQTSQADEFDLSRIRSRIAELGSKTAQYSEFGLMPKADVDRFLSSLDKMGPEAQRQAESVLEPYLDGQFSRLENLASAERVTRTLIDRLNEFLVDKQASYHVRRGLQIRTTDNVRLAPSSLSSGERQLVLLFCNAVLSRDATGVFIIDEPELSLNSKWQRRLVQALLDCVEGTDVQFIMATHSIEIVTKHRQYLVQLGEG